MAVLKSVRDKLDTFKDNIQDFHSWFEPNYKRFNKFRKFIFDTSLSNSEIDSLASRGMPQLEFNILEAVISRLRSEFSRQEPNLQVVPISDADVIDPKLIETVEGYVRSIMSESNRDNFQYDIFTDQLSGGFSVAKVYTGYRSPKSFDQDIYSKRVSDPTLCGFDKMAETSHKGDGQFCYELYPKTKTEFENMYGTKYSKDMNFSKNTSLFGYNWAYQDNMGQEMVLVGDYYDKKIVKKKLVQLISGHVMEERSYEKFLEFWNENNLYQAPAVVAYKEADFVTICRHVICQNEVIDYTETDFRYLPLVFVDGNSIMLRDNENGATKQITRPYVYHAEGVQRLKNYAGISLANELENLIQSKLMAAKESIPEEYKDAYIHWQRASTLIYNAFKEDDPTIPIPAPTAVQRVPAPPEVMGTFTVSDEITRAILGNYDAALNSPNNNQLSGEAIAMGAMQSNSSSGPYNVSYIKALNRIGEITLDLIPKYITNPRSIPQKGLNNKRSYSKVNVEGAPSMNFEPDDMEIRIEAGVNFEIQRARSFEMLNRLMQTMPIINEYISTDEHGIEMLLDNIDIRGIDALKQNIQQFVQEKKQMMSQQQQMQQQQMQMQLQMAQQNNPALIKQAELKQRDQEIMLDAYATDRKLDIEQQKVDIERSKVTEEIILEHEKNIVAAEKIDAQNIRSEVDLAIKKLDTKHGHAMDILNLHHNKEKHRDATLKAGKE